MAFDRDAMLTYVRAFVSYVDGYADSAPFTTFGDCLYLKENEAYKDRVFANAQSELHASRWTARTIGTGEIASEFSRALRLSDNLVSQYQHYRFENRTSEDRAAAERAIYDVYRGRDEGLAFESLRAFYGGNYDLVAYFFFLKDKGRFLPICPGYFDKAFANLGIDLKVSRRCSWENYTSFVGAVAEVRDVLELLLEGSAPTLLDAHSFLWMNDVLTDYINNGAFEGGFDPSAPVLKDVPVIGRARVGQGGFRKSLVAYWRGRCAVTGCDDERLLVASHIKPWVACDRDNEWLNPYNGLLLCAAYDSAFDTGLITFGDDGAVIFSPSLDESAARAAGIDPNARLRRVEDAHKSFLSYHRENVFLS